MEKDLIQKIKYILNWTRKKVDLNEIYFKQTQGNMGRPYVSAGEIYYADLGTNIGAEIDKERPVLVFQNNDRYIRRSNLVFIIPISSNVKPNPYKVFVKPEDIFENNGIKESSLLIQQAKSISKNRLCSYKGKLCEIKMREILIEFNRFLQKDNPLLVEGDAQVVLTDSAKSVH